MGHRLTTAALAAAIALAALAAAGCTTAAPAAGSAPKMETEQQGSGDMQAFTSTAMVIAMDDGDILFVDQKTDSPYYPGLDRARIVDADGREIAASDLVSGSIAQVTGNGIMLESYPGQYPGITEIKVLDEGSPENTSRYRELIDNLRAPNGPAEPARATVEYRTADAVVAILPLQNGYTWAQKEDGQDVDIVVDTPHPVQIMKDTLPDACIGTTVSATATFDAPATGLTVTRWREDDIAAENGPDPDGLPSEQVGVSKEDGAFTFSIEPGWRYALDATFDAGGVQYVFTARS